jgi:hypothetical protein
MRLSDSDKEALKLYELSQQEGFSAVMDIIIGHRMSLKSQVPIDVNSQISFQTTCIAQWALDEVVSSIKQQVHQGKQLSDAIEKGELYAEEIEPRGSRKRA